jgi:U3 small nucleolar RNA-associated protein 14
MARLSKIQRSSNPPLSSRPSTFKRRANRLRNSTQSDVYEYQPHKVRRAHISLSLDKDEAHEHGAASDDDADSNMRKPRLIGENVEDEDIPSEDDEELDSDAAFEESDEDRFAGFSFPKVRCSPSLPFTMLIVYKISLGLRPRVKTRSGTKTLIPQKLTTMTTIILWIQKKLVTQEITSMSSMSLMAVQMMAQRRRCPRIVPTRKARVVVCQYRREGRKWYRSGRGRAGRRRARQACCQADEDVSPSALEGLEKFVSSLETSKKRKGDSDAANNSLPRKRKFMEERTAVGIEGEFAAVASGTSVLSLSDKLFSAFSGQQLRLDDLLAPLGFSFCRRALH